MADCYEEEYCENAKTSMCKKCERNFDNFDIADNYKYKETAFNESHESTVDLIRRYRDEYAEQGNE